MARIGREDTSPELLVRRAMHRAGLRYRLHRKDLPGTPDIVLPGRRVAVFVHGCFWHAHHCRAGRLPKTRTDYWAAKFQRNIERDEHAKAALEEMGWRPIVIWECEAIDQHILHERMMELTAFSRVFGTY
jgi:DNA mismatch endonuclease (patch repair protein)